MNGKYGSITIIETKQDGTKVIQRIYPTTPFKLPKPRPADPKN